MRQLIEDGYIGEVLSSTVQQTLPGAGARRQSFAWATDATKGASTLSIATGHLLDAVAYCPRRVPLDRRHRDDAR